MLKEKLLFEGFVRQNSMSLIFFSSCFYNKKTCPFPTSLFQCSSTRCSHQISRKAPGKATKKPLPELWTSTTCEEGEVQVAPRSMVLGSCFSWRGCGRNILQYPWGKEMGKCYRTRSTGTSMYHLVAFVSLCLF